MRTKQESLPGNNLVLIEHHTTYLQRILLGQIQASHFKIKRLGDAKSRFTKWCDAISV
jgi:hypothetical protein